MIDAGKLRSVEALDAVGQSSQAAEVGRVVAESRGGSYGCFAPKLCGRIEAVAKAVSRQSGADVSRR